MHRLLTLSLLLACSVAAAAAADQRTRFQQLLEAAETGQLSAHEDALAALEDYPLYPYLLAADLTWRLRHEPGESLDREIQTFLADHQHLPVAATLRQRWVADLTDRGRWQLVEQFVADSDGTALQCDRARALIHLRGGDAAAQDALALWHSGTSQPDSCDPVFAWLADTGRLTPDVIRERARLAVIANQAHLVRYLAKKLPQEQGDRLRRWAALSTSPGDLRSVSSLPPDVAVAIFERLAIQDPDAAAGLLPGLVKRLDLDAEHAYRMRRYIALLFAQNHRPEALAWFERLDEDRVDETVRAWRIRAALYQQRWTPALNWIETLPPDEADTEKWRYWRARVQAALGRDDEARAGFAALAEERSYHGYLAADRLHRDYSLNAHSLSPDRSMMKRLRALPGLQRAHELLALDMNNWARAEWQTAIAGMSAKQLEQAALIAHDWDWHSRAIITLARSDYWDDLDIRYPLPYRDAATKSAHANDLDPALVLAIMRTESLFMTDAVSSSGAYGLMQLKPGTARQVAAGLDMPRPGTDDLQTPAVNIRLGSRYLRRMLDRFNGNLALAIAAYNAGPRRIESWLPERNIPADIWVENIPYEETREYVRRALSHMTVFQARLGRPIQPLAKRMAEVEPAPSNESS